jgi:hypothetical protein
MALPLDQISASTVAAFARETYAELYGGAAPTLIDVFFGDIEGMFAGNYLDYQKIDTPYHNFEHTLRVTACLTEILAGRHQALVEPRLAPRQFELAVAAALLHDIGYLKLRSDVDGTGAKYTYTHVLRSCALAAAYLPTRGVALDELEIVLGAIRCTNPNGGIRRLHFQEPIDGIIACAVATADFLGQMSAPNYLAQLPLLFAEFEESDNFSGVSARDRMFASVDELISKTPLFWKTSVLPKLENDLLGLYRFLASPYPDGNSRYLAAIDRNIEAISEEATRRAQIAGTA